MSFKSYRFKRFRISDWGLRIRRTVLSIRIPHSAFRNLASPSLTLRVLTCFVAASLCFGPALAQSQQGAQQQKQADDEEVVKVRSHLVNVDVSVKDRKGNYVNDLKADDFTVYENGVRQKIEFFNPPLAGDAAPPASGGLKNSIFCRTPFS